MQSIFNALMPIYPLFLVSLISFFTIFTIRQIFVTRMFFIILYHACFILYLFFTIIGGGGVQNDGYKRLEEFILLEENNQLEDAKQHPEKYSGMLQIDLKEFKNSAEFKNYLQKHDSAVDKSEAICVGWIFVFLADTSLLFVQLLRWLLHRKSKN